MTTMKELEQKLQLADYKQARIYLFCNFIALMLISAYSVMMLSPTVLNVLPEGGDSRKQMIMIFVLTLFGCTVFTVYAASLFFRKKSGQLGILMAMGASRKALKPGLFKEVLTLSSFSSLAGIAAGFPFVWILWNCFRLFVVDSAEMKLRFNLKCLLIAFVFAFIVILFACITAGQYLKRTNIIDIIQEEHRNEPVKELGRWCGPMGLLLLFAGGVSGYLAPGLYISVFSAYPSALINLFYIPVFIGLYMVMLHTVVYGWRSRKKEPYKNIISRSMMKFQGKQTVNNLLVSTVLIAGACFAVFYLPMLATGQLTGVKARPYDYMFHYRSDQNVPERLDIENMASRYDIMTKDWGECEYITLGIDGNIRVEEANGHFHLEYRTLLQQGKFLAETDYNHMTGQNVDVLSGTYLAVSNTAETGTYWLQTDAKVFTNMVNRQVLNTQFAGMVHYDMLTDQIGYYVLDDKDYREAAAGLSDEWKGMIMIFNVEGADNYAFANEFFRTFVSSFDSSCELPAYYDTVTKISENERGEIYWGDTGQMTKISFQHPDSSDFRAYWTYMPKFRILDYNDFLRNFAVYLMVFLFIFIVCILSALIISYTRCQTIAINNRYVFDDLKRLGASPEFLTKEVKMQCQKVFRTPSVVGISTMFLLYCMLMYANDGKFSVDEMVGLLVCGAVLMIVILIIYFVYRKTVIIIKKQLEI